MLLVAGLLAAPGRAEAQTYYRGYDVGPDYGAMVGAMLRRQQQSHLEMQRTQAAIVRQAMQDPTCQAMYRRHLASGGQMSFADFAYQYAATAGFTPEGVQAYRRGEALNQAREREALHGLRDAEQGRAAAQRGYGDGYARNQQEAGNVLQGRSTWTDPTTGYAHALPYMGPVQSYDPATGNRYARDAQGNQWVLTPDGYWHPMAPGR